MSRSLTHLYAHRTKDCYRGSWTPSGNAFTHVDLQEVGQQFEEMTKALAMTWNSFYRRRILNNSQCTRYSTQPKGLILFYGLLSSISLRRHNPMVCSAPLFVILPPLPLKVIDTRRTILGTNRRDVKR